MTLFENLTGIVVKDCLIDNQNNTIYFIIEEGKAGIAIGRDGNNVKNVEKLINKEIKIFEFSKDLSVFVKNLIPQITEVKIKNENNRKLVEVKIDKKDRALVIGRDSRKIKIYKELLQRNHNVDDIIIK